MLTFLRVAGALIMFVLLPCAMMLTAGSRQGGLFAAVVVIGAVVMTLIALTIGWLEARGG